MRILTACCLVFLALCPVGGTASARSSVLAEIGPWQAYHTRTDNGASLCGILQFNNGLGLLIKMNDARETFIHLTKDSWAVPQDVRMGVAFVVDGQQVASLRFAGTPDPTMIEGNLTPEQAAALLDRFALGQDMRIHFLTGNEGFWSVPLQGTYKITQAFFRCLTTMLEARQPFDPAPEQQSQPF